MIPPEVLNWVSIFAGLCSIAALVITVVVIPRRKRSLALVLTSVFIGTPVVIFVLPENPVVSMFTIAVFAIALVITSFFYGRTFRASQTPLQDMVGMSDHRPDAHVWLQQSLEAIKPPIEVDAMGVKLDALYKVVKGVGPGSQLPQGVNCKLRVMVLGRGTFGAHMRSTIEQHSKVMGDAELYNESWTDIAKDFTGHQHHHIEVRAFEFTPAFYIIRVNNRMLVGTYLAETGYESLTLRLEKHTGSTFDQFRRYFESVWQHASRELV